jgi:hypothetical protein
MSSGPGQRARRNPAEQLTNNESHSTGVPAMPGLPADASLLRSEYSPTSTTTHGSIGALGQALGYCGPVEHRVQQATRVA